MIKKTSFALPSDTLDMLEELANQYNMPKVQIMNMAIHHYANLHKDIDSLKIKIEKLDDKLDVITALLAKDKLDK